MTIRFAAVKDFNLYFPTEMSLYKSYDYQQGLEQLFTPYGFFVGLSTLSSCLFDVLDGNDYVNMKDNNHHTSLLLTSDGVLRHYLVSNDDKGVLAAVPNRLLVGNGTYFAISGDSEYVSMALLACKHEPDPMKMLQSLVKRLPRASRSYSMMSFEAIIEGLNKRGFTVENQRKRMESNKKAREQ